MKDYISVIIPAFNEEATIEKVVTDHLAVLKSLPIESFEILCLDDASTDSTFQILKKLSSANPNIRVIHQDQNKGIYESFSRLAREAIGTHLYQTGADGQWPAENLSRLYQKMVTSSLDLVIGVRENRKEIYSTWRQALSFGFNLLPKLFFGVETKDANGIKLGIKEIFSIKLNSQSFFGEIERIVRAKRQGCRIGYETIVFLPREGGKATGAKWKNVFSTLRDFIRYLFNQS